MHHGEMRESGTHEELLAVNGVYATLYHLQYKLEEKV
jgi:ABC-type multidrug transport system fused ATPase/permease subunit